MTLNPDSFWRYSLDVYARPGVADTAIRLQEQYGINVNMLLLLCWCLENGVILTLNQWQILKAAIAETEQDIRLLRIKRREAKPLANTDTSQYDALKKQELDMEAQQQAQLVGMLNRLVFQQVSLKGVNGSVAAFVHLFDLREHKSAVQGLTNIIRTLSFDKPE